MNPALILLALLAACWHAWLTLAVRTAGPIEVLPLLLVGAVLFAPWLTRLTPPRTTPLRPVPTLPLVLLLSLYSAAVLYQTPLLRIVPAALAVAYCLYAAVRADRPRAPFFGLVLLALPVLPSLEFYCAYPVRLVALQASAALLRMNGVALDVAGLALHFDARAIQFDAPCSGVRMLWTCWFLTSALAYLYRFTSWRYVLALAVASLLAIAGNILRATSLFYLEAQLLPVEPSPWAHEAVGIVAFCMTVLLLLATLHSRRLCAVRT